MAPKPGNSPIGQRSLFADKNKAGIDLIIQINLPDKYKKNIPGFKKELDNILALKTSKSRINNAIKLALGPKNTEALKEFCSFDQELKKLILYSKTNIENNFKTPVKQVSEAYALGVLLKNEVKNIQQKLKENHISVDASKPYMEGQYLNTNKP